MGLLRSKSAKNSTYASILTIIIIGFLVLVGPARAIDVSLITPDIDIADVTETITLEIAINEGEFLPVLYTDVEFSVDSKDVICRINSDNSVEGCSFLSVNSVSYSNLNFGLGYGYGYGYNIEGELGYNDFGFGYGYGYGERGVITGRPGGTIRYELTIETAQLPAAFFGETVRTEATVFGGTEDNLAFFRGRSFFDVFATEVGSGVDPAIGLIIEYPGIRIEIPPGVLPADATNVTVVQVSPTATPSGTTLTILGKTFELDLDSLTKTFSGPITITIFYTDEDLEFAGITDESTITPAFYNPITGLWETVLVIERNVAENWIKFQVDHFTEFALLGDTDTTTTTTTTSTFPVGSSSGGGNRGSVVCDYKWECDEWSACQIDGLQIRSCTNIGTCSDTYNKPSNIQECGYTVLISGEPEKDTFDIKGTTEEESTEVTNEITGSVVGNFFTGGSLTSIATIIFIWLIAIVLSVFVFRRIRR